jgi:hypothetical protein
MTKIMTSFYVITGVWKGHHESKYDCLNSVSELAEILGKEISKPTGQTFTDSRTISHLFSSGRISAQVRFEGRVERSKYANLYRNLPDALCGNSWSLDSRAVT